MDRQPAGLGRMACHDCALRRDIIAPGRGIGQRIGRSGALTQARQCAAAHSGSTTVWPLLAQSSSASMP